MLTGLLMKIWMRWVCVVGVAGLVGCGSKAPASPELYPVTGSVIWKGQPLATGNIVLDPDGGNSPSAAGGIENGKFTMEVTEGPKIVRISAVEVSDKKDEYGSFITNSIIPNKYNVESNLKQTVSSTGKNHFEIKLD